MKITINPDHATRLERRIAPPMGMAVTLPLDIDGVERNAVCVYVCTSAFMPGLLSAKQLQMIAREVAMRLANNGAPEP